MTWLSYSNTMVADAPGDMNNDSIDLVLDYFGFI